MGKTYKQFFLNFNALKTHFILNTYALVNHQIKFYQFQSLPNLHFYKILNLEEITLLFSCTSFPTLRNKGEEQSSTQLNWHRLFYHYPHIKSEAEQICYH